ncbi:MAG: hypothetical protein ACRCVT_07510 [Leadbetterella sp.]
MYKEFGSLPKNSRVWVYLADRDIQLEDKDSINKFLVPAIQNWAAHSVPLEGSFSILENRFLIIAVDVNANLPSGCSIDSSTQWIKALKDQLGIDFLYRAIVKKGAESLDFFPIFGLKKHILSGELSPETLVYDLNVDTLNALENGFLKPAQDVYPMQFNQAIPS